MLQFYAEQVSKHGLQELYFHSSLLVLWWLSVEANAQTEHDCWLWVQATAVVSVHLDQPDFLRNER